ncbi:UDP-3-O-(3-hydroxymyristoyl)glucosamine N-acyltransferase [Myxococcota bacterium]|nr:UDP-3-O-(3-hydroxymyristoyl)glucosamine N-acyltransferase [Myxococcota bacterium]
MSGGRGPGTAAEVAALVGGALHGPDRTFSGVGSVETAEVYELAFAEKAVPEGCRAGVLLARQAVPGRTCVVVAEPKRAFMVVLQALFPEVDGLVQRPRGAGGDPAHGQTWVDAVVHPGATVHPTAHLGPDVTVHPGCYVGAHCVVGEGTVLYPNVVLYPGTELGQRCRVHAGTVIGADGFSYEPGPRGPVKVPQVGRVIVGDDVEIGPNCVIDRAFLEQTRIGDGSKLDGLVMIAHNVAIGRGVVIAAQVGLAGSVQVGDGAMRGGQAGGADHRVIGRRAMVAAQAGVGKDVPDGEAVLGSPAMPLRVARRVYAWLPQLPEVARKVLKGGSGPG